MNPITINIKVGLEDTTLEILTALVTAAARTEVTPSEQKTEPVEQKAAPVEQKPAKKEQKVAKVEPSEPSEAEDPKKDGALEDMPDFSAEITDTDLRAVVTETRQRVGSAAPIRAMMAEKYGIKLSTECPQERRAEFINDLKAL